MSDAATPLDQLRAAEAVAKSVYDSCLVLYEHACSTPGTSDDVLDRRELDMKASREAYADATQAREREQYRLEDLIAPTVVVLPPNETPATTTAVNQVLLAGQFTKTKSGVIHGTVRNGVEYLRGIPWMQEVYYDEFSQRIFYQGEEWSPRNETPQLLAIQCSIPAMSPETFARAVEAIALSQRRDRLKDWINTQPRWDRKKRLTLWLSHAFGCPIDRYHMRVGRNWLISMIARGLDPGCKVDTMPVLEGLQGKRKSTALDVLAQPFFLEAPGVKFGDRDFLMALQGTWLIEMPELSALRAADVETIKATITKRVDRYRAPYARREADHKRRHVFAGTVNESDYLRDSTGNRRFLPIECVTVNLDWLKENRDQLFAEALHAYRLGRKWHHFPKAATEDMQDDRLPADPWASLIDRWLLEHGKGTAVLTSDNLHAAAGVLPERRSRATESRLGRVMKKSFPLWRKEKPRVAGGSRARHWVYEGRHALSVPPPPVPATQGVPAAIPAFVIPPPPRAGTRSAALPQTGATTADA